MRLLIFAHKKEAQAFLSAWPFRKTDEFPFLYHAKELLLLVSDQKKDTINARLNPILNNQKFQIDQVINMGVAGALRDNILQGTIYTVDSVVDYHGKNEIIIDTNYPAIKLLTNDTPVKSADLRSTLAGLADIVDMELFHIASMVKEVNIPLASYKLISDMADENTCKMRLKGMAPEISSSLFSHFSSLKK